MIFNSAKLHAISEVQTTFHWFATFEGPPFATAGSEQLEKRCTTLDVPKGTHARIDLMTHGYQFPVPGRVNRNGDITITFFETVQATVVTMMHDWHKRIWQHGETDEENTQTVDHADVFAKITMELLDKKNSSKPQTYILHHCIIADIDQGGQLSDGSSPDYFKPVLNVGYAWFNYKNAGRAESVSTQ